MHYWPLIVLAFMAGPAFGQAELSTIISPTTFPISPAAGTSAFSVTPTGSPATVVCAAGCASAGASPSTVIVSAGNITNTVTVSEGIVGISATGSPATVNISGAALGVVQVNVAGGSTLPVSINAPPPTVSIVNLVVPVSQAAGTSAFSITATGSPTTVVCAAGCASAGASPTTVVVSAGNITNTVTVSEGIVGTSATGSPATVVCLAGCGSAGASPSTVVVSAGNVTATGSPASVVLTAQGTVTTSPVAGTIPVSPTGAISIYGNISASGSPASVIQIAQGTVAISPATGTSAFIVSTATGTLVVSPVATTIPVSMSGPVSLVSTTVVSLAGTVLVSIPVQQIVSQTAQFATAEQTGNAYPNRANYVYGSLVGNGGGNNVLIKAQGAGVKIYVTNLGCGRTDSATSDAIVGFNISPLSIGTSFSIIVPPTSFSAGAVATPFPTPLTTAANTSLSFTISGSSTVSNSLLCQATGFAGP